MRHRPQQHAVGRLGFDLDGIGERVAAGLMRGPADRGGLEGEAELEARIGSAQHGECRRGDLGPDAVAFQHQDIDRTAHNYPAPCLAVLIDRIAARLI